MKNHIHNHSEDTRIALLEQSINNINNTLLRFEKRFDQIDARFDKLEKKMDARCDQLEARIDNVFHHSDAKIDRVSAALSTKIDSNFKMLITSIFGLYATVIAAGITYLVKMS